MAVISVILCLFIGLLMYACCCASKYGSEELEDMEQEKWISEWKRNKNKESDWKSR